MSTPTATNPKEALVAEVRTEYEVVQKRLKELQSLIQQSQAEVRRFQQRWIDVTTQVSRMNNKDYYETMPRNDIKVTYEAALDTQQRLLTVQNQLEKFNQDRSQLDKFGQMLDKLLQMLEGVGGKEFSALPGSDPNAGETGLSNETLMRIIQSQESERQRLARLMHDGPAQSLTNFILQAEICRRLFDRNPDRAGEELDNLKTAASTTFQRVRDYIFELRPMMLDDLGLAPTMRRYVDVFSDKSGIDTKINMVGEERRRLEPHTEILLFRCMQDLMNFSRDAANSTKVDINLDISGDPVKATFSFNGKVYEEIEAVAEQTKNKIMTLDGLKERVVLVGGTLEVESLEGEGNRAFLTLPTMNTHDN